MVELIARLKSPFNTTGTLEVTGVERGQLVHFALQIDGDPTAPEMPAKIVTSVGGEADPMTDFKTPVLKLNGEVIDIRSNQFVFPAGGHFTLNVYIQITSTAKWFKTLRIRADCMPADW